MRKMKGGEYDRRVGPLRTAWTKGLDIFCPWTAADTGPLSDD